MFEHLIESARQVELPWRDRVIALNAWADDDFGHYDYLTQDGRLAVNFHLCPDGELVTIVVDQLNGSAASPFLPATIREGGTCLISPATHARPKNMPAAILLLIVWSEALAAGEFAKVSQR